MFVSANIALDDVSFIDCGQSTSTGCDFEQFQCSNGQCIGTNSRCDFVSDCSDGSDEMNCPTYQYVKKIW